MGLFQSNRQEFVPHSHATGGRCPLCEQPVGQDIARRIEARRHEQLQTALKQARAEANAALEQRVAAARTEAKQAAEQALTAKLADFQAKLTQAEQERADAAAAVERKVAEAKLAAETALSARLGELQTKLAQAEQARTETAAALEQRVAQARQAAESALSARLVEFQAKLAQAEEAKATAAQQLDAMKAEQQAAIEKRVQEVQEKVLQQKEDLQREKEAAVLAEKAKVLKLQSELQDMQRKLEGKSAHELGEGSEVDLFEQLRSTFESDRIQRVPKGVNGADVIHEVIHNGKVCGKIIYDAKNRNAWQNEFAVKLRADKLAQGADHAILSSNKFPKDRSQVHCQDGVIIANPARVVALVEILRDQLVRMHELRVSNEERGSKTEELYGFITSEHFRQLLAQVEAQAGKMTELDGKEQEAHRRIWDARAKLIRSVQKARSDLAFEIDRIIGTAGNGPEEELI